MARSEASPISKQLLVAVAIPAKNTCGSTHLGTLKLAWGQVQDVPRAFAQRVCESAQGEGPLEEHLSELPCSSGMVGVWM